MDEGIIRMQAEMYALVTQMNSIMTEVEGMKAANIEQSIQNRPPTYQESDFHERIGRLNYVMKHLREDI